MQQNTRRLVFICAISILMMILLAGSVFGAGRHSLEVGRPFPRLDLPQVEDGRLTPVESLFGVKLVLHIWASW